MHLNKSSSFTLTPPTFHVISIFFFIMLVALRPLPVPHETFAWLADYPYFLNRLYFNKMYFLKNGFFQIPYYTPLLGGGIPSYADPLDMNFSLLQLIFNWVSDTHLAFQIAFLLCLSLSYTGCYLFYRRFQIVPWLASIGAFVFSLNGWVVSRWLVGHLISHGVWALPWVLLHVKGACEEASLRKTFYHLLWIAIFGSLMIYSASVVPLLLTLALAFSYWLTAQILRVAKGHRTFYFAFGIVVVFLLSASRVVASHDFLKHFPRLYGESLDYGQIFWILPTSLFNPAYHVDKSLPVLGGWHEYCAYIGLSIAVCLIWGAIETIRNKVDLKKDSYETIRFFLLWSGVLLVFVVYGMRADAGLIRYTRWLPFLKTIHAWTRLNGALPLVLVGLAVSFLSRGWESKKVFVPVLLALFCVCDILLYHAFDSTQGLSKNLLYVPGRDFQITSWSQVDLNPYDRTFGGVIQPHVDVKQSPLFIYADGTYNTNDPVAVMYQDDVGREPWSRIPTTVSQQQVERFLRFENPDFFIPKRQKAANIVSLIAWAISILSLAGLSLPRDRS